MPTLVHNIYIYIYIRYFNCFPTIIFADSVGKTRFFLQVWNRSFTSKYSEQVKHFCVSEVHVFIV